jgi:DMSO/TMAO reductase YedYZ heme-binding membrane subunit
MFKGIFTSRKFWAALVTTITLVGTVYTGEITWTTAVQGTIGIWAAYILGTGIAKAGEK